MRLSVAIAALVASPSFINAFNFYDLQARHADANALAFGDYHYSHLYSREANPFNAYSDEDLYIISKAKRSLSARYAEADALHEAHIAARDQAHALLARAALAFPEAFALPAGFKVPATPEACKAKRIELTKEYHDIEDNEFKPKATAYKSSPSYAAAAELEALAQKIVTGRNRAAKVAAAEGCKPDGGSHANEIQTWQNEVTKWGKEKRAQKAKLDAEKKKKG